ncbi:hypothetical protein MXMO3_03519 (plasmid) [Maritalea myrionectae]|uniref:Uncharacterized protein n=1 Tax=Maritalea myrionectae TaxID=454601 RepID=A0A2R4MJ70_9HYPH|nr:hypothetical protein [Maritalea myrionectae]AVX06022.1 hypothetical protein MXMO3_03519 [Maritalea myrionectae]
MEKNLIEKSSLRVRLRELSIILLCAASVCAVAGYVVTYQFYSASIASLLLAIPFWILSLDIKVVPYVERRDRIDEDILHPINIVNRGRPKSD